MIAQRTPEWLAARRQGITSTDLPIILGLSPYRSEAALAREKMGEDAEALDEATQRRFRLGLALEAVIRSEDELEHGIRIRRVNRFLVRPDMPWAMTSLDFERVGERTIVEAKSSRSRRWDDGLPQDVEAQVRWQMGVGRYPRAHVAVLRSGDALQCFDVEHDESVWQGLVAVAQDFRRRLAEGGPFTEDAASVRARYPSDNGAEMVADIDMADAVQSLLDVRSRRKELSETEERIETAIKSRMGDVSALVGPGFRVTWKRSKDSEVIDWPAIGDGLLRQLPESERAALVGIHTTVRQGARYFRVVVDKED